MTIKNGSNPANPIFNSCGEIGEMDDGYNELGLTKREHFAIAALQGLLVNAGRNGLGFDNAHKEAVNQADLLLKELEK